MNAACGLIVGLAASVIASEECPVPEGAWIRTSSLEGLAHTRVDVVRQELKQSAGSRFSCARWMEEKNRLKDLGVFARVSLVAGMQGDSADLHYRFQELPPLIPLITIANTDQDGFSIGPHLAIPNFLGTAKKVHLMARFLGTTEYKVSIAGHQLLDRPVEFEAAWVHVDSYNPFEGFHENSHSFRAESAWPLGTTRRFSVVTLAEGFWIQSDTAAVLLNAGGDWIPRLGLGLRYDGRDRAQMPRRGIFTNIRVTQNGGNLGGLSDFREWQADLRGYFPITARQGLAADALYQLREPGAMGRYDRFHAGGVNTLRGYARNAFQGRNECLLNAEYAFDLVPDRLQGIAHWAVNYGIQALAGIDAAALWDGAGRLPPRYHPGYYVGLHALIPGVDRLRLEIGTPGTRFSVQVYFGMFEKTTAQRWRIR